MSVSYISVFFRELVLNQATIIKSFVFEDDSDADQPSDYIPTSDNA